MDQFKKNIIESFNNVKDDVKALENQISKLQKTNSELKQVLSKLTTKNVKLEEKIKVVAKKPVVKKTIIVKKVAAKKTNKVAKKSAKTKTAKKVAKKSVSRDANLVACAQDHEMAAVLKYFKRSTSKENIKVMQELCKQFKANKTISVKNRENFYKYLGRLKRFTTIQ